MAFRQFWSERQQKGYFILDKQLQFANEKNYKPCWQLHNTNKQNVQLHCLADYSKCNDAGMPTVFIDCNKFLDQGQIYKESYDFS